MTVAAGPTLSRLVRGLGKAYLSQVEGKFSSADYEAALVDQLGRYDLNDPAYRRDIARTYVRSDLADRSKLNPFVTGEDGRLRPEQFSERIFSRGVIRLGDRRYHVKMPDATAQQWLVRQLHQQQAAQAAQNAATLTTEFLQTEVGILLLENPRMTTGEAMHQLRLWPNFIDDGDDEADADDEE